MTLELFIYYNDIEYKAIIKLAIAKYKYCVILNL